MDTFTKNLDGTITIGFGVFTPADFAQAVRELPKITPEEGIELKAKVEASLAKLKQISDNQKKERDQ